VLHPNYLLIYDEVEDRLRILRVLHAAREWPRK
jgi:plasmid stabilization system protein ParE